VDEVDLLKW